MEDKDKGSQHLRYENDGQAGDRPRADQLMPQHHSGGVRAGEVVRAKRISRPVLSSLSPEELVWLLRTDPARSFTRPELRKIVRGFGYHLDRASHRYWHPRKPGWIALPLGKSGIVAGMTAREILKPLLDGA